MNRTKIEWVKNPDGTQGYTWNPITGCLNGCEYCYARKLAKGRLRKRYLANNNLAPTIGDGPTPYNTSRLIDSLDPFYPRFWKERLSEPYTYGRNFAESGRAHKGIFVCDMGELFGDWVPREWQEKIFHIIKGCSQHRFYLLTKQAQNLPQFSPFPENCWVGVTATSDNALQYGLAHLTNIEAKIKYISFEPLLGKVNFLAPEIIDWLIIGQQTMVSAKTQPKIEWIREIVEAADKAGVKVFLKDNLLPLLQPLMKAPNLSWFGNVFGLRQEMPEIK